MNWKYINFDFKQSYIEYEWYVLKTIEGLSGCIYQNIFKKPIFFNIAYEWYVYLPKQLQKTDYTIPCKIPTYSIYWVRSSKNHSKTPKSRKVNLANRSANTNLFNQPKWRLSWLGKWSCLLSIIMGNDLCISSE